MPEHYYANDWPFPEDAGSHVHVASARFGFAHSSQFEYFDFDTQTPHHERVSFASDWDSTHSG